MRRSTVLLLAGLLVAAPAAAGCGAPAGAGPAGPTHVAAADPTGVTPVRFDHRAARPVPAGHTVPTVVVPRGLPVDVTVGSDVHRRVLVPEQGRSVDLPAGRTVTLRFLALGTFTVRVADPGAERGGVIVGYVQPRGW